MYRFVRSEPDALLEVLGGAGVAIDRLSVVAARRVLFGL
jgi:hypothetical protein